MGSLHKCPLPITLGFLNIHTPILAEDMFWWMLVTTSLHMVLLGLHNGIAMAELSYRKTDEDIKATAFGEAGGDLVRLIYTVLRIGKFFG